MSTVDSLLVVAASAVVRDYYQKVRHPNLDDVSLVSLSRKDTDKKYCPLSTVLV